MEGSSGNPALIANVIRCMPLPCGIAFDRQYRHKPIRTIPKEIRM
jgi:hypothetical protein